MWSGWMRLSAIAAVAAILDTSSVNALPVAVPDPAVVAIFNDLTSFSFDPVSHAYFATGPVTAVQLPGQLVVDTDPLIAAGAIMTQSGTFTGSGIDPFPTFDPTGHLIDYTIEVSIGAQLVYSETFSDMTLFATYTVGNSVTAEFAGNSSAKFVDVSVVDSPVLNFFAAANSSGSPTWNWVSGTFVHNNSDIRPTPEPGTAGLMLFGLAVTVALARRRAGTGRR